MNSEKLSRDNGNQDICDVRIIHMEKISQAKAEAVSDSAIEHLSMTYKMLGDPTRLKILMALKGNEMCVCDLAAFTGSTESAVSHQLRRLRDLSLVKKRRDGQILYYSLDDRHVDEIVGLGMIYAKKTKL